MSRSEETAGHAEALLGTATTRTRWVTSHYAAAPAALAQIPAAWVITSVALTVFGWALRLTAAVWGLLAVFIALGEFGVLWNAPQWLMDLSPFQHTPLLPSARTESAPWSPSPPLPRHWPLWATSDGAAAT